jgi:hypothetical protein
LSVDRGDDVGAGLAADEDRHRALAVEQPHRADVFRPSVTSAIGKAHRRAVAPGDDGVAVIRGIAPGLVE